MISSDLKQAADRAMQQCRAAAHVTPQMQQAVKSAHDEASKLKKSLASSRPSAA